MARYSLEEAADRAGVTPAYFADLVAYTLLTADAEGFFTETDARRASSLFAMTEAGIPLEGVVSAVRAGYTSFDFLDSPVYSRFAAISPETFEQVSVRTKIPIELLTAVREALGSPQPKPTDRVRDQELEVVPFLELGLSVGFNAQALEGLLRVIGDSMGRVANTEADVYYSSILAPRLAAGLPVGETEPAWVEDLNDAVDRSLLAIYHGQQARTWARNVTRTIEGALADAGLHETPERYPAICFLDITGYTRLTQERGDAQAASVAADLGRLVQRTSAQFGGAAIKWLGDGVMFHFPDPGSGVAAALEMVTAVAGAGLPPAHVGLHCGPVLFQEGDYFGQTVNMSARIGDFARPGEVLVSDSIVLATSRPDVKFTEIGPVELKGVSGAVQLFSAHKTA